MAMNPRTTAVEEAAAGLQGELVSQGYTGQALVRGAERDRTRSRGAEETAGRKFAQLSALRSQPPASTHTKYQLNLN